MCNNLPPAWHIRLHQRCRSSCRHFLDIMLCWCWYNEVVHSKEFQFDSFNLNECGFSPAPKKKYYRENSSKSDIWRWIQLSSPIFNINVLIFIPISVLSTKWFAKNIFSHIHKHIPYCVSGALLNMAWQLSLNQIRYIFGTMRSKVDFVFASNFHFHFHFSSDFMKLSTFHFAFVLWMNIPVNQTAIILIHFMYYDLMCTFHFLCDVCVSSFAIFFYCFSGDFFSLLFFAYHSLLYFILTLPLFYDVIFCVWFHQKERAVEK